MIDLGAVGGGAAVAERVAAVRARIAAAGGTGRVRLVAMTKGFDAAVAAAAVAAGVEDLGESYAQELAAKAPAVAALTARPPSRGDSAGGDSAGGDSAGGDSAGGDSAGGDGGAGGSASAGRQVRWHFAGRVQTNKVKLLAGIVHLWHSVDRPALGDVLASRALGAEVLVQVNVAGNPGQAGCAPAATAALVEHLRAGGLRVAGLMAIGPPGPPEQARPAFRALARLADDLGLPERSMGMSDDLEVAVEEGATMVRVGRALFGDRPRAG